MPTYKLGGAGGGGGGFCRGRGYIFSFLMQAAIFLQKNFGNLGYFLHT